MSIGFELRSKVVQKLADTFDEKDILYDFSDVNSLKIYLSKDKSHSIQVDFVKEDEFYAFRAQHHLSKREIDKLYEILLIIHKYVH